MRTTRFLSAAACGVLASLGAPALAQPGEERGLGAYFGFEEPRFIVVDDGCTLADVADVTGDGLRDVVVINNRKSRIEIHAARRSPREERELGVNEIAASPWYDRIDVTVRRQALAALARDVNGDGLVDLLYAGRPGALVALAQTEDGGFERLSERRVRGLQSTWSGFSLADVTGDAGLEVVTLVDGRVGAAPLGADGSIGEPALFGQGDPVAACYTADVNGDGYADVVGVTPESAAPVRVWLQTRAGGEGRLGAERRFETPPLREADPAPLPGRGASGIAVIERPTRRIVLNELVRETVDLRGSGSAEAPLTVRSFANPSATDRGVVVADLDADGLDDVIAADPAGNRVEVWRQRRGDGLASGDTFSSFKKPSAVAVGQWDSAAALEVFVVSEEENVVGVSSWEGDRLTFPSPIGLETAGGTPVAVAATERDGRPLLAVAVKDRRDIVIEIHSPEGPLGSVEAADLRRTPDALRWADADQDGSPDVLVLTDGEPMVMVRTGEGGAPAEALGQDDMAQYGLVSAAGAGNTATLDVDGDGLEELLIADANFVRACRYEEGRGWVVVEQITDPDPAASYAGVDVMLDRSRPRLIVADSSSGELKMFERAGEGWEPSGLVRVSGFGLGAIRAGSFDGAGGPGVLAFGGGGFAHALLSGERWALRELSAHRNDEEDRLEHEIAVGDVNSDGFSDLIVLDAQRQMVQVLTVTASGRLLHATEFQAFETRSFGFDQSRGFEPRQAMIADATGDGAPDLLLVAHDRIIVHPQATREVR